MNKRAKYLIKKLSLKPHPEGGFFREILRQEESIKKSALPSRYSGARNFSTSIYYLLEGESFSSFHKLASDEYWNFCEGSSLTLLTLDDNGKIKRQILGSNLQKREKFQLFIEKEKWFCGYLNKKNSYALVTCIVVPGFEFDDYQPGKKSELTALYPQHKKLFDKYCLF